MTIDIRPINLGKDLLFAFKVREELAVDAFGNERSQWPERVRSQTLDTYRERLVKHMNINELFAVHAWLDGNIVGQCELNLHTEPQSGYVSLFWVDRKHRSKGIGRALNDFAVSVFKKMSFKEIFLTVQAANERAQQFYLRNSWQLCGPHLIHPDGLVMRKTI